MVEVMKLHSELAMGPDWLRWEGRESVNGRSYVGVVVWRLYRCIFRRLRRNKLYDAFSCELQRRTEAVGTRTEIQRSFTIPLCFLSFQLLLRLYLAFLLSKHLKLD